MKYKITNNEKTVWVNGIDRCIGRFCPVSHEYLNSINDLEFKSNMHLNRKPTNKDWETFCSILKAKHEIEIPEKFKPTYLMAV